MGIINFIKGIRKTKETNTIETETLKEEVYHYYMNKINEKHSHRMSWEEQQKEIEEDIKQLLDEKIRRENSSIHRSEITAILESVLAKDTNDSFLKQLETKSIQETFPKIADVTIENQQVAKLYEMEEDILGSKTINEGYLYVPDNYYQNTIQYIEKSIERLEEQFSAKDLENFNEQFSKDLTIKQYELENANEYENALRQIKEREKKYDAVKQKMINDYGKKYQAILAKDIPEERKQKLLKQLLEETKSYDEKTNQAAIQLEKHCSELNNRFANKSRNTEAIMEEMKNNHLFDREAYLQEQKAKADPRLAKYYNIKEKLNQYRTEHGQEIYKVKPNFITNILNQLSKNAKGEQQLLLEYHPEKEIATGVNPIVGAREGGIDEKLVKTLAHLYAEKVNEKKETFSIMENEETEQKMIDTTEFEAHLVQYFRAHYNDLMEEGYNHFLSDFAEMPDEYSIHTKKGELSKIARQYGIDPEKFRCFGYKFSIREGLIYEDETALDRLEKVYYATDKGINSIIEDLYGQALYQDHTSDDLFKMHNPRKLKNDFVKYAKQHGINIENEYALETMEVNQNRVKDVSKYLNDKINEKLTYRSKFGIFETEKAEEQYQYKDYTDILEKDITENYSTIMNVDSYNFNELSSIKELLKSSDMDFYLHIGKDNIQKIEEFDPEIVYATSEYCAREYANIMEKINLLKETSDPFLEGYFDFKKANKMKTSLRKYIQEHNIDIDTSIKQVPIDQERIDLIANTLVEQYGHKAKDAKNFKGNVIKKLEENWSEMMTEMQVVSISDMFKDELEDTTTGIDEHLYVKDDFTYLGDYSNIRAKCIYATPQALQRNISKLNEKIHTRNRVYLEDEKRAKEALINYAIENDISLDLDRMEQETRSMFVDNSFLGRMNLESMPDDPTARKKIDLNDNIINIIIKMSEGNPGGMTGLTSLINKDPIKGSMLILGLDDMNMRGSQIWEAYKYYCEEDVEKFAEAIKNRSQEMVDFVNKMSATENGEKAVTGGASFDRNKMPDKYRFTAEEVRKIREDEEKKRRHEIFLQKKQLEQEEKVKKNIDKIREKRDQYKERKIMEGEKTKFNKMLKNELESDDYDER